MLDFQKIVNAEKKTPIHCETFTFGRYSDQTAANMEPPPLDLLHLLTEQLKAHNRQQRSALLEGQDDAVLWALYQGGDWEALAVLFQKYHRQIVVLVSYRTSARLEMVEDAFGDFVIKLLKNEYQGKSLEVGFQAFGIHCVTYLVRSKARLVANSRVGELAEMPPDHPGTTAHPRFDLGLDFPKIIDFIPSVNNPDYRMVLWLSLVMGYESNDLVPVFGQRETAYNKRYRAIKAFREVLVKGGMLDELK